MAAYLCRCAHIQCLLCTQHNVLQLNMRISSTEATPEIDNLYLDMNGIIHNCTHANQREVRWAWDRQHLSVMGERGEGRVCASQLVHLLWSRFLGCSTFCVGASVTLSHFACYLPCLWHQVKMTEEEMILKVFNYLEKLINVAKPRKLLFMAIDGKTGYEAIRANLIQGIDTLSGPSATGPQGGSGIWAEGQCWPNMKGH